MSISNPTTQYPTNLLEETSLADAKTNGLRLQALFDRLPASGGTVVLPSGRYYICQTNPVEAAGNVTNGTISTPLLTARRTNDILRNNYSGWVGLRFNAGTSPLDVTHLGRWIVSGNTGSHELRLYKLVGGNLALVASTTLNTATNPAGQFAYEALTPEVTLEANTTCYLFSREVQNGDYWINLYDSEITMKGDASGAIGVWSNDPITQGSIGVQGAGHCFGPVNLKFQATSRETVHNYAALLKKSNVTIQGNGSGTTLVAFNRVTTIFYIGGGLYHYPSDTAVTNIVLKDITFEGNPTIDYAGFTNQVGIVSANNLGSICNPLGSLVVFGGRGNTGVDPTAYSQNLEVRHCVFRNPSSSELNLLWVRDVLVENCGFSYFENIQQSLANSLKAWCGIVATAPRVENVVIRGNWFNGNQSMEYNGYGSDGLVWLSNGGQWVASGNRMTNYYLEAIQFNAGPYTIVSNYYQTINTCNSSCALNTTHGGIVTNITSANSINSAYCFVGNRVSGGALGVRDPGDTNAFAARAPYNLIVSANDINLTTGAQWPDATCPANTIHLAANRAVTVAGNAAANYGRAVAFQNGRTYEPASQQARILVVCNDFGNSTHSSFFVQDTNNRLVRAEFIANRLKYGWDCWEGNGYGNHLALGTGTARPPTLILRGNEFVQGGGLSPLLNSVSLGTTMMGSGWKGLRFTVGDTPLVATYLGRWKVSGNIGTHTVRLFSAGGGSLTNVTVDMQNQPAGEMIYGALAQPYLLQATTTYILASQEAYDQYYGSTYTGVTLQGATGTAYPARCATPPFTIEYGCPNHSYGPLDFICCLIFPAVGANVTWSNPGTYDNVALNQTGQYYINSPSYWANSDLRLY